MELITLNFFEQVQSREDANYIVILDRSASMRSSLMAQGKMSTRWAEVWRSALPGLGISSGHGGGDALGGKHASECLILRTKWASAEAWST